MNYELRKYFVDLGNSTGNAGNVSNVSNVGNFDYLSLFSEVSMSQLLRQPLQTQILRNFMTNVNTASLVSRNLEGNNFLNSSLQSRSSNAASSPLSLGSSTGVNRRNVPLSAKDDFQEIELDGHKTPSVMVGGEARIPLSCVENIVHTVVKPSVMKDTLAEHNIRPVDCTENEFALLRMKIRNGGNVKKIQLLTHSLSEFLIRVLLHEKGKVISRSETVEVRHGVRVKGRVFGKQRGFFRSDLYVEPDAQCIECDTCGTYFSPEKFLGHTHQPEMRSVVHWGYKPSEWRRYLHLFRDKKNKDLNHHDGRQREIFQEMLNRFAVPTRNQQHNKRKTIVSQGPKNIEFSRKRHVKNELNDGEYPPVKRMSRDLISDSSNPITDALYAPNVNVGTMPYEGKSAFTPIERKDMKESGFSKEDAMMDRLKKQYQLVKDGVEKLHISNSEKQSMLVEWANLNQGFVSLYNSMKNRIMAHKQAEHQVSQSMATIVTEMDGMRSENLNLKSQLKLVNEEMEKLKKMNTSNKPGVAEEWSSLPRKERLLYRSTVDALVHHKKELETSEQSNQSLRAENQHLKAQLQMLMGADKSSESLVECSTSTQAGADSSGDACQQQPMLPPGKAQELKVDTPLEDTEYNDADEIDSAATESAPGSSQPGSPDSPVSPYDVIDHVLCHGRSKAEAATREHDEDEVGPPTLTREQD